MEEEETEAPLTACGLCRGACCESFTLNVNQTNADFYLWLKYHGEATDAGLRFDCACKMLKDGRCSIYADRPKICREYKVGSRACLKAIDERRQSIRHKLREVIDATT